MNMDKNQKMADRSAIGVWKQMISSDPYWMALLALGWLMLLTLINMVSAGQYGFHRDELNFIENARHLDWGYVEYPPLAPFIGRVIIDLFGVSLVALRFTAALVMITGVWLTGMMARALGGGRRSQALAMFAAAAAPLPLTNMRFFSYQTFDYLWWVLIAYLIIRLVQTDDPRWWLAIGATLGLGMMTKYSIPFLIAGIIAGVMLTPIRKHLKSPWLWGGVALSVLIFLPNLIWMIQHEWITLDFQTVTRARNMAMGRTDGFLIQQLYSCTNAASIPLWMGGLYVLFFKPEGKPYRILGWIYLITLLLFMDAHGRFYYMAGAYPMLFAVGSSLWIHMPALKTNSIQEFWNRLNTGDRIFYPTLLASGLFFMVALLPFMPKNCALWRFNLAANPELGEEIGWPEQVQEVARIYTSLSVEEQSQTGILTGNYGEAGAVNLYGPAYGLPDAISGINTFWLHGYGNPPPQTVIILGFNQKEVESVFADCSLAGHTPNPYNIVNEEIRDHPDIFLCRKMRVSWSEFWKDFHIYG
jgi:hypothetical protein